TFVLLALDRLMLYRFSWCVCSLYGRSFPKPDEDIYSDADQEPARQLQWARLFAKYPIGKERSADRFTEDADRDGGGRHPSDHPVEQAVTQQGGEEGE